VLTKRRKSNKRVRTIFYCLSVSNKRCLLHEGWSDQTDEVGIRRRRLSGCRRPYRGACAGSSDGCDRPCSHQPPCTRARELSGGPVLASSWEGIVWACVRGWWHGNASWWPSLWKRDAEAAGNPRKSVRNDVQDFLQDWATPFPVL
jgi:hypothetical protein